MSLVDGTAFQRHCFLGPWAALSARSLHLKRFVLRWLQRTGGDGIAEEDGGEIFFR